MEKKTILRVSHISKSFGGLVAVDDVSFEVKRGQIKALIGPNGAGKTTLFNIISGFYLPDKGSVEFSDINLNTVRPYKLIKLGISRTFQNIQLADGLRVIENVALGLNYEASKNPFKLAFGLYKKNESDIFDKAYRMLSFLKIDEFAYLYPNEVPFGVRRLVELARAAVSQPKLLLLDEPAAGLNEAETEKLLASIFRIWENGVSILLIEHDIDFVSNISHSIVVMDSGKKIAEGFPSEILNDDRVIRAYIGE